MPPTRQKKVCCKHVFYCYYCVIFHCVRQAGKCLAFLFKLFAMKFLFHTLRKACGKLL